MIEDTLDLLGLRNAPLPRLLEALQLLLERGSSTASLGSVVELAVDEAVRLVRGGSRPELVAGGETLAAFLGGRRGANVQSAAPGAYDTLSGLLPVLTAASSPASKGGEEAVLRSWNGKARAALAAVAAERRGFLPRAELRERLEVSESYLSHLLADLEAASLLERVGGHGRRSVDVRLTSKGRDLVSGQAAPEEPAQPAHLRSVRRPRGDALCDRLDAASKLPGGPSSRFRRRMGIPKTPT
jgi:hypothetical protein